MATEFMPAEYINEFKDHPVEITKRIIASIPQGESEDTNMAAYIASVDEMAKLVYFIRDYMRWVGHYGYDDHYQDSDMERITKSKKWYCDMFVAVTDMCDITFSVSVMRKIQVMALADPWFPVDLEMTSKPFTLMQAPCLDTMIKQFNLVREWADNKSWTVIGTSDRNLYYMKEDTFTIFAVGTFYLVGTISKEKGMCTITWDDSFDRTRLFDILDIIGEPFKTFMVTDTIVVNEQLYYVCMSVLSVAMGASLYTPYPTADTKPKMLTFTKELRQIKHSDVILTVRNIVDSLNKDRLLHPAAEKPTCRVCAKDTTMTCSKCMIAAYCSKDCQIADWNVHKIFCKNLAQRKKKSSS